MRRPAWLFRNLRVGLKTEIILNLALLMTSALLLLGLGIIKIHERDILNQKVRSGKIIVKSVQNSLNLYGVKGEDLSEKTYLFHRMIQVYADPREIDEIAIVDPSQRVLACSLKGRRAERIDDEGMAKAIAERRILWNLDRRRSFLFSTYRDLRLFSPLLSGSDLVGGVYVRLSLADVMGSIAASQRLIILFVLLDGVVIVLFGSFLLSRVIVNPLKALVAATDGIGRGDYDQRISVSEPNEIGRLAESFNEMTDRLRESQKDVQEYVRSLERANEQLRQTQMELVRSEKLASIGRFAAGVAHEVGNPLGAILGYTSILQNEMENHPEGLEYLKRIEVEIQRINKIIRELLDFSRPSAVDVKEVDLNSVIESSLSLLSYQKSFKNIESNLCLKKDLPPIEADESQIRQVLVNLILNAVDSMPDGGTLTLRTEDHEPRVDPQEAGRGPARRRDDPADKDYTHLRRSQGPRYPYPHLPRDGRFVCVSITDTGCGISPDDLEKIFDPFFTTKDPDRGTGLGLSISLRIVESFGGKIEVESRLGKGSTFKVLLPASGS
ncbi:MAG: HAMP domain-containing protein [Deltaproteobacteria bacterium]|nr:HAMP domain-containing protein [Deltaproteobacteria bacterium]MBW2121532.1 HAMP domain-containing protein [Deltaproteobacteria bacterium]